VGSRAVETKSALPVFYLHFPGMLQAMDRRLYDRVQTARGGVARAYAATNSAEYFAELTCAYLDRCDCQPFTRAELKEHDPTGYRLMESVWRKAVSKDTQPADP
jgi:hypothetical protein